MWRNNNRLLTNRDKEFLQEICNLITLNYSAFLLDKQTGNYNIRINFSQGECVNFKEYSEKTMKKEE